jgi:hypothetical protein
MYERIQGNDMYNGGNNVPFSAQAQFNNVFLADPQTSVLTGETFTVPILPANVVGLNRDEYRAPRTYQYSIGVQEALGAKAVLSVAYVGSQSRNQNQWRQINLPDASTLPGLVASGGAGYNQLVPFLGFREIRWAENVQESHYNGLQASIRGQVHPDLTLSAGYTLSKAIDPTGNGGSQNGYDLNNISNPYVGFKYDEGPSAFDRRHVAYASFIYDIPLLKNSPNRGLKAALGGWQVSSIVTVESGAPLNILMSGTNVASVIPNIQNRPDINGSIRYPKRVDQWFDTSVFSAPADGEWGNLPAHSVRGPGRQNWTLAVFKNFAFTETARLEFRAEAFNAWNHPQFLGNVQGGGISNQFGASNFGAVTGAYDPRTFQFGLKLFF